MSDLSVQVAWNYPQCDHFSVPPHFFVHIFQLSIFFSHNQFAADCESRCILSATTCCIFGQYASSAYQALHLCQVENEAVRNVSRSRRSCKHENIDAPCHCVVEQCQRSMLILVSSVGRNGKHLVKCRWEGLHICGCRADPRSTYTSSLQFKSLFLRHIRLLYYLFLSTPRGFAFVTRTL